MKTETGLLLPFAFYLARKHSRTWKAIEKLDAQIMKLLNERALNAT